MGMDIDETRAATGPLRLKCAQRMHSLPIAAMVLFFMPMLTILSKPVSDQWHERVMLRSYMMALFP
jgi:hypothetical protein